MKLKNTIISACLLASSTAWNVQAADSQVLATINGTPLTQAAVENFMQHVRKPLSFKEALAEMITIELLVEKRLNAGIEKESLLALELDRQRKALIASDALEQILSEYKASDEEINALYKQQYLTEEEAFEYNASHILVKEKSLADDLIKQLNQDADFSELAKAHSTGPSSVKGGNLGWFAATKMVKPFADATAALTKGHISQQAVQTQFGWHIIKLNDKRKKEIPTLESVRENIITQLSSLKIRTEIQRLQQQADIQVLNNKHAQQ